MSSQFQESQQAKRGFTLVEILIVVVIIGILAAIVIPKFSNASLEAREATLKDELRYMRTQIEVYKAQHNDSLPGYPNGDTTQPFDADLFVDQLTLYTDLYGNTSTVADKTTYRFGRYLTKMPINQVVSLSNIQVYSGTTTPTPDGSTGWIYQPTTGRIWANLSGSDGAGRTYISY